MLKSWGPGKFDAQLFLDGKAFRPDGKTAATLMPAAFGLAGVNLHTYTGWGGVSHWNAFVANLEMHGQGTFLDAAAERRGAVPGGRPGRVRDGASRPRPRHRQAPRPAVLSAVDPGAETAARQLRRRRRPDWARASSTAPRAARPVTCRRSSPSPAGTCTPPPRSASTTSRRARSPDERYRTTPLGGLFTRQKGGFYHDGRFATLGDVVEHYDRTFGLNLSEAAKRALVEYLKSL